MDGYLDWNKTDFGYHKNLIIVPDSCCKNWIVQDSSKFKWYFSSLIPLKKCEKNEKIHEKIAERKRSAL